MGQALPRFSETPGSRKTGRDRPLHKICGRARPLKTPPCCRTAGSRFLKGLGKTADRLLPNAGQHPAKGTPGISPIQFPNS